MFLPRRQVPLEDVDYATLAPGRLVNGVVIDGYLRLVERRSLYYKHLPQVWSFSTSFLRDWDHGLIGEENFRRVTIDLFARDLVLIPVRLPDVGPYGHWILLAAYPKQHTVIGYDPLGFCRKTEAKKILNIFRRFAAFEGRPFEESAWTLENAPTNWPRQTDGISCGVYVCVVAERLAKDPRPNMKGVKIEVQKTRVTIANILRAGKFDTEDFGPADLLNRRKAETPSTSLDANSISLISDESDVEEPPTQDSLLAALDDAIGRTPEATSLPEPAATDTSDLLEDWEIVSPNEDGSRTPILELQDEELEDEFERVPSASVAQPLDLKGGPSSSSSGPSEESVSVRPLPEEQPAPSGPSDGVAVPCTDDDLIIPDQVLRELELLADTLVGRLRRNHKSTVFRPDGTPIKVRSVKILRLLQTRKERSPKK